MSRLFSISVVSVIVAAAAVGLANPGGGIGGLLVDGVRQFVPAAPSANRPVVEGIQACTRDRGLDLDAVRKRRSRDFDHLTTSTLAHCYLTLSPTQLCDRDTRVSAIAAVNMYLSQRVIALRYLRQREDYRTRRRVDTSPVYDGRIAEADRQAEAYLGESEIDHQLVQLAQNGLFTADDFIDDFTGRKTQDEIKKILGNVVVTRRVCETRG